ncbi:hypothetical protein Tco_0491123 [Tanacetum coccineum]
MTSVFYPFVIRLEPYVGCYHARLRQLLSEPDLGDVRLMASMMLNEISTFSHGKKGEFSMVTPKVTPQLPKPEEYGRRVKRYEGFRVDVKRKSIKDKVRHEVFDVDEALDIENSRASSFQVRGIHVDATKVNAVRDWSSPKTLPEDRNNKVANAFQEEDELEEKICFIIIDGGGCKNLMSMALVKDFKLPIEPHHSHYQIGWIKKGPTLKVTEICKVPLDIEKHYNELVTCNVVDIEASHTKLENKTLVTLVASPKEFQTKRKKTGVSYALVVKDVTENAIPVVIKPLLAEFGKIVTDDTPDAHATN